MLNVRNSNPHAPHGLRFLYCWPSSVTISAISTLPMADFSTVGRTWARRNNGAAPLARVRAVARLLLLAEILSVVDERVDDENINGETDDRTGRGPADGEQIEEGGDPCNHDADLPADLLQRHHLDAGVELDRPDGDKDDAQERE